MPRKLIRMIERASGWAEKKFARTGMLTPMWHAETAEGEHLVLPAMLADKDMQALLIRVTFQAREVVRYVFVDEVWVVPGSAIDKISLIEYAANHSLEHHPQRQECVLLMGEDEEGQLIYRRPIVRPQRGAPYLDKLEGGAPDIAEGRFTGMLPRSRHDATH